MLLTTDSLTSNGVTFFFSLTPPAKSHLVVGFLGTVKCLIKGDLIFPMKENGSLSSSSAFFGILEVDWDTTMLWKIDAMDKIRQVELFVFQ